MTTQTLSKYSQEFIEARKKDLLERKTGLEQQLSTFAEKDPHSKDNYNADYPDFGYKEDENAAEVADFERNLSLEENLEQSIEMINRALKKVDKGTYGVCEKCGNQIQEERLVVMPTATKCTPGKCLIKDE